MGNLTLSDKYGIGAALGLLVIVLINNPIVMLVISAIGIAAGFFVVSRGQVRRVALVAFAAFVIAGAFAVYTLVLAS
jgi:hypothetical protein